MASGCLRRPPKRGRRIRSAFIIPRPNLQRIFHARTTRIKLNPREQPPSKSNSPPLVLRATGLLRAKDRPEDRVRQALKNLQPGHLVGEQLVRREWAYCGG